MADDKKRSVIGAIFSVSVEEILQDTGSAGKPFYAKVAEYRRYRFLGIPLVSFTATKKFPNPGNAESVK